LKGKGKREEMEGRERVEDKEDRGRKTVRKEGM
jgi:hypothetical protein